MAIPRNIGRIRIQPDSNQSNQGNMVESTNIQPTTDAGSVNKKKRVRGPTFMCMVWGMPENERIQVSFNDKGQSITNNSVLSHFLGSLARNGKYAPLYYRSWRQMPEVYKNDMVSLVLQKIDASPAHKCWILKSLAKKWRSWKSKVKASHFNSELPIEEQKRSPPDRVQPEQWKELVNLWHEEKMKTLAAKNKTSRGKQVILYGKGKIPLAVIREAKKEQLGHDPSRANLFLTCFTRDGVVSNEALTQKIENMRNLIGQVPEGEHDTVGPSDVFSQVMGKEKPGSVRMYGLGVCPSDVWGTIPSSGTSYRMSMEWRTELDKTKHNVDELRTIVKQLEANAAATTNFVTSQDQIVNSSPSTSELPHLKVRDLVCLKSVVNQNEFVGKGWVISLDPTTEVGGEELGQNWCEVHILVPIKWEEHLMRPYRGLKTVGDAIGVTIAWPVSLVVRAEDD